MSHKYVKILYGPLSLVKQKREFTCVKEEVCKYVSFETW